jgi:hypothetical protein
MLTAPIRRCALARQLAFSSEHGNVASMDKAYWFPAKRHGWGWGIPGVWQGWAVLAAFFVFLLAGAAWVIPSLGALVFVGYAIGLCAVLMAICWLKGEPPRWRWGGE